jgi:hypothetical protein
MEKKKEKNKMSLRQRIFDRAILIRQSRHQVGVSGFRIDSRTIKRCDLDANMIVYMPLGELTLAFALGPSEC